MNGGCPPTGNNRSKSYLVNMILISLKTSNFHQMLGYLGNCFETVNFKMTAHPLTVIPLKFTGVPITQLKKKN
jgi:hypothetical protein